MPGSKGGVRRLSDKALRVAIVEDHLLQRRRAEQLINADQRFFVIYSCATLPDLMSWVGVSDERQRPQLLVLDLMVDRGLDVDMSQVAGLVASGVRVLVFSALASAPLVADALRAGVSGVLSKQDAESDLVAALHELAAGESWITPTLADIMAGDASLPTLSDQEERVLVLYASGLTLSAVAVELGITEGTARGYLKRAKGKYAAAGRPIRTKVDMSKAVGRDGLMIPERRPEAW